MLRVSAKAWPSSRPAGTAIFYLEAYGLQMANGKYHQVDAAPSWLCQACIRDKKSGRIYRSVVCNDHDRVVTVGSKAPAIKITHAQITRHTCRPVISSHDVADG